MVWPLALPFLLLAAPTPGTLLTGSILSFLGLCLRAFAAGSIHKEEALAVGGPYSLVRHPLYVGSFLVGTGLAWASGQWWLLLLFFVFFAWLYGTTISREEAKLEGLFGDEYLDYRRRVPPLLPRISGRPTGPDPEGTGVEGFRPWLYWRNKEWQAAAGTLAGYGLLLARMWLWP